MWKFQGNNKGGARVRPADKLPRHKPSFVFSGVLRQLVRLGVERIAMLKHGIPDLRAFFESDLRWLRHYGFAPLDAPSLIAGPGR